MAADRDDGTDDLDERQDRQLDELLSEVRIVLPGATVLFSFLLTLPFTARFEILNRHQRAAYFVAFMTTGVAIVLLVAEVAYHRLRGHPYDKGLMVRTTGRQTVGAVGLLGVALVAVVYLVSEVVYPSTVAIPLAGALGVLSAISWIALPIGRRRSGR